MLNVVAEQRKYNEFEKKLLINLLDNTNYKSEPVNLLDFFKENILNYRALEIDEKGKWMSIHYNNVYDKNAPIEILNFLSFIDYLESNGLIIKFENIYARFNSNEVFLSGNLVKEDSVSFIKAKKGVKFDLNKLPNIELIFATGYYDKVKSFYNCDIFISPELVNLINNKFMTTELEIYKESKIQTYLSFTALGLALVTLFLSWYILYKSDKNEILINQEQIESLKKPMEQLVHIFDDINQNLKQENNLNDGSKLDKLKHEEEDE